MHKLWEDKINRFIALANQFDVKMLMVGGGAVNFYGYQRHSADVDFWIKTSSENLNNLIRVFKAMHYEIEDFPKDVKNQLQNISVKFSPLDLNLELITKFSSTKTFEEAYKNSVEAKIEGEKIIKWRVLSYNDLIDSKLKAQRPKDLLDIQQLQEIHRDKNK